MGWLNRMTQFKDKAGKNVQNVCLGLYAYPVLMAADILVYKATHVPVGEDQKQHVELTRDIAGTFNRRFKVPYFELPEPVIKGPATRVMSLRDGSSKMSKSDISDLSRIHLTDDADTIAKKIKKAKTDTEPINGDYESMKDRLEARNLINMLAVLDQKTPNDIAKELQGNTFSVLKEALIESLHREILPIGQKINEYMKDTHTIDCVLKDGKEYARTLATRNLKEIYEIVGLKKW
jgi:tryptophanyl-tRNA synthetase